MIRDQITNDNKRQGTDFLQSMGKHIVQFFGKIKGLNGDHVNQKLIGDEPDDEKQELIREMCEDVELFYKRLNEMRLSGLTPSKWFECEIENNIVEVYPEVTPEETDEVKRAIASAIDEEIVISTEVLADEIDQTKDIASGIAKLKI